MQQAVSTSVYMIINMGHNRAVALTELVSHNTVAPRVNEQ